MFRGLGDLFAREIAGRRALEWTAGLSRFHRDPGTPGHRKALDYVLDEVERIGFDEVEAREYTYDGKRVYYSNWASVAQWTPRRGLLEIVAPEHRVLADFTEIPVVLGIHSASTPPGGLTAELVDVGPGYLPKHYEGKEVRGKIVLCDPNGQLGLTAVDLARLNEARGVVICSVIDHPPEKTRLDRPDHIGHVWTRWWWQGIPHDFREDIFSFSISQRQVLYLRGLLSRGPVVVRAIVDVEFGGGTVRQISGLIRGSELPDEEVVYLGHVDHPWPSANDNASGCALMMEQAHTLMRLIRQGVLSRPRRSVRFLWDVHCIGGVMWAEDHPGWGRRVLGGFSPDSIGLGAKDGTYMRLLRTSDTRPSYLNDLTLFLAERMPLQQVRSHQVRLEPTHPFWVFKEDPCTDGVDAGPINDRSIGAHAMGIGGYLFDSHYHTDRDTYDRLDVQEFERVGWLLTTAGYAVADADHATARSLAHLVAARTQGRLAKIVGDGIVALDEMDSAQSAAPSVQEWLDRIGYLGKRDVAALHSIASLDQRAATASTIRQLAEELSGAVESAQASISRWAHTRLGPKALSHTDISAEEAKAAAMVPIRRFEGPFNTFDIKRILASRLGWERTQWLTEFQASLPYPSPGFTGLAGLFFAMDGTTDLLNIARGVKFAYGVDPNLGFFIHLMNDLSDAHLIDVEEIKHTVRPTSRHKPGSSGSH